MHLYSGDQSTPLGVRGGWATVCHAWPGPPRGPLTPEACAAQSPESQASLASLPPLRAVSALAVGLSTEEWHSAAYCFVNLEGKEKCS